MAVVMLVFYEMGCLVVPIVKERKSLVGENGVSQVVESVGVVKCRSLCVGRGDNSG